jgi:two-component system, LytTR family, response regulator
MSIRALIVDDENLARKRVRKLLAPETDIEIIGECADGPQAIKFIRDQRPDLVFLDVQMPEVTGFDVLRALPPNHWPEVIFVTAHDRHAIEAFEVQAVDYLLKPFTQARLHEAVRRVVQRLQRRDSAAINHQLVEMLNAAKAGPPRLQRIAVRTGSRTVLVKVEDIDYFESAANYVVAHTSTENHVLRNSLTHLETELPPRTFVRISRSTIVNINRIKAELPLRGEA